MEKIVYNVLRKVAVLPVYQIYASLTTTIATITSIVFPCISSDFHLIHRIACADSAQSMIGYVRTCRCGTQGLVPRHQTPRKRSVDTRLLKWSIGTWRKTLKAILTRQII